MYDRFNRYIDYLRISVTDKCNLRCRYCMPEEGIQLLRHEDILSFEEITRIVEYGAEHGIRKVRLTGGEPLVRRDIVKLVDMISRVKEIEDFSMTTNGMLLPAMAQELRKAGLQRINVSLDTLDPEKYSQITRHGKLSDTLAGIDAADQAGLKPIKINMVLNELTTEEDKNALAQFSEERGYQLRFIHQMDLEHGTFSVVEGGAGGDCKRCNRLRLTANGKLKPCLFSDIAYDIRKLGVEKAFSEALRNKPKTGTTNSTCTFNRIGG